MKPSQTKNDKKVDLTGRKPIMRVGTKKGGCPQCREKKTKLEELMKKVDRIEDMVKDLKPAEADREQKANIFADWVSTVILVGKLLSFFKITITNN